MSLPQFLILHASDTLFPSHLPPNLCQQEKIRMFGKTVSHDTHTKQIEYLFSYLDHMPLRWKSRVFQLKNTDFWVWIVNRRNGLVEGRWFVQGVGGGWYEMGIQISESDPVSKTLSPPTFANWRVFTHFPFKLTTGK